MYNYQPPDSTGQPPRQLSLDLISQAWQKLTEQMGPWILTTLIVIGVGFAIGVVQTVLQLPFQMGKDPKDLSVPVLVISLVFGLIQAFATAAMTGGIYQMALNHLRGYSLSPMDIFKRLDLTFLIFGATLLVGVATFFGTLFCILPGLLLATLFAFTIPLMVDRGLGVTEAMSTSFDTLKSNMWTMLGIQLILGLISFAGALACGIGLLWTTPLMILTSVLAYRQFFPDPSQPDAVVPITPTILGGER